MPRFVIGFVRLVDRLNYGVGRFAMYLLFVLMAILMWSSISKALFMPSLWTLEMAQFVMVAYYILGGPYAMQNEAHVRMDLFYAKQSPVRRAWWDGFTVFALIFYLAILIWGAAESFGYSLGIRWTDPETSFLGWSWPQIGQAGTQPHRMAALSLAHQARDAHRFHPHVAAGALGAGERHRHHPRRDDLMTYEMIAALMFSTMLLMMMTGQRVFGIIGFVAVLAAMALWGTGGHNMGFSAAMKLMKWYPLLSLPMFVFMGYIMSESRLADDLYRMFHVWFGPIPGGLAIGTILLMVLISAMNGLSVAGMAIGSTIALPELLRRGYQKQMVTGVIQAGSSLGILIPPSVVLVLYAMIARAPVSELVARRVIPGLMMAALFILYVAIRCRLQPELGPAMGPRNAAPSPAPTNSAPCAQGHPALHHLLRDDVPLHLRLDLAGRKLGHRRGRHRRRRCDQGPLQRAGLRNRHAQHALHLLHVHVGDPCRAGLRRGFRWAWRSEGHRKPLRRTLGFGPWTILILMQVSFLLMGMFLDDTAMLVIVAPLYVPLVATLDLGIPPQDVLIWYGVLYTITCQIAYLTPPSATTSS
jgi:TRAP-type mannitol/chloroaromatic compound transport system permease large subunit/TRAP-type mannitol/chloroaromatic compound transport system permease small subunit